MNSPVFVPFLVKVEYDAGDAPHHIQKFELKIREGLKPSLKITAYGFFALMVPEESLNSFLRDRTTSGA